MLTFEFILIKKMKVLSIKTNRFYLDKLQQRHFSHLILKINANIFELYNYFLFLKSDIFSACLIAFPSC